MRRVGGAHRGLDMWLMQRASAVYLVLYLLALAGLIVIAAEHNPLGQLDYGAWRGLFMPLVMKLASLLFILSLLVHAWIGMREVFIDYLHCGRCLILRLALYFAFAVLYMACLAWAVDILWSVK